MSKYDLNSWPTQADHDRQTGLMDADAVPFRDLAQEAADREQRIAANWHETTQFFNATSERDYFAEMWANNCK